MKNIIERIAGGAKIARYLPKTVSTRLAVAALAALAAGGAWASIEMTNPVTGQKETYVNTFTGGTYGTGTEWNDSSNWDTSVTPFVSGDYNASLVDGKTASTSTAIDGWTPRVGAYNGATNQWNGGISKIQAGSVGAWLTADATSAITIASFGGNQLEGSDTYPLKLTSANAGGITWNCDLSATTTASNKLIPFYYYIDAINNGSVVYTGNITVANDQVIKQVNIKLTGTSQVLSKTLVSFASTTKTFTADAAIKVYGTDGTTLVETVNLAEVKAADTLTTSDPVGSCELVQTSTGIVLYYVDGDPSAVVAKTYTPSININFCFGNAPLTTAADVGYSDYAVPGTSWNNMVSTSPSSGNGTFTTPLSDVYAVKTDGTKSRVSGASVALSGTPGSYRCNSLAAATDLRHGYIDENDNNIAPTVTVSGIPYDKYKVVVYTATDTANIKFGYITVNGTNYTYSEGALTEGTTSWGTSGADNSANAIAEGANMLVTPTISGATATIVGHKSNGRGCIAAVQIVKVAQQVGENDLLIELDGDETYTFDETKAYSGTVYVLGEGTVTFAGTASTATTLHIGPAAAVNMVGSSLTPATVTGNGTVVYDDAQPSTTLGFADSANWTGTVWVKNIGEYDTTGKSNTNLGGATLGAASANPVNNWGNAYSFVKFTNVKGYMYAAAIPWTLILEDDGANYAWYNNNGWGSQTITIAGLKGDGTFYDEAPASGNVCNQPLNFTDGSAFLGTIYARGKRIGLGGATTAQNAANAFGQYGSICIPANGTATVSSGKTWSVYGGFIINGTLNDNGTLATLNSSAASIVSGSGTVVFTARLPTPADTSETSTWWKNANWTGTVWIKSHAIVALDTNLYGNEGSTLKFTGVTGYFAQDHVNTVPIELENSGSTAAFNYNNGWGGELLTFRELKGTGTLQTSSKGDGGTIWVKKWDAFTGVMNLGRKQVVMGGSEPAHDNVNRGGKLVIAEGAVVTNLNATTSWAAGGIEVNGTFAASDRTAWADDTAMTVNSTGVLNMYGSGVNDTSKSFANVTGTGTIWYSQTTTANDKWSALPSSAANMFANTLSVSNDNVNAGVIITMNGASDVVTTNANISGTGYFRSDWGTGACRGFLALQSKNTTWSGTFGSSSRIKKFIVAGVDGATDRTLTLAGTQSSTIPLTVESLGSVNITGTYLGATTVSGTFGGTGTLTGNLTFNAGSTFKAFASDENGLSVSGTVAYPEEGTVTVDVSDLTLSSSGSTLITFTSAPTAADVASKMVPSSGTFLKLDGSMLKAYPLVATYNGENYATFKEAIDAALADEGGEANLAQIAVVDGSAELPGGYHISDNTVVKYPVAVVKNGSYLATGYTDTILQAIQAIYFADSAGAYDYIEIVSGSSFVIPYGLLGDGVLKIKNTANATPIPDGLADDCITETNEPEGEVYTEYLKSNKPTTYTWVGGVEDTLYPGRYMWATKGNWRYANSSSETVTASRQPQAGDSVVFNTAATVNIAANTTVEAITTSVAITFSKDTSDVNLSATTGIVLTDAAASITVSGVTLSPTPTTTVANSYVKLTGSTYSVDTYKTVTFAGSNFSVAVTTNAQAVAVANNACTVEAGAISFTITPSSGYHVTAVTPSSGSVSGEGPYAYTVSGDATITVTTALDSSVEIGAATFEYGVDFTNATVTVAVTETNASGVEYTLTVGAKDYTASAVGGTTVTFNNVEVPRGAAYGTVSYGITSTASATTGETSGSAAVADVQAGWINENATTHGQASAGGSWTNAEAVTYSEGKAAITDNRFEATTASTASRVVLEFNVCFSSVSDANVDGDAQGAIKLGEENSATTFTVLAQGGGWTAVSNDALTPDPAATYKVVMTFDYKNNTYAASVNDYVLTNASGSASFPLAATRTGVQNIDFAGSGTLTSMKGDQVEGYMVKDNAGNFYPTIQEATQAYSSANGPYTVLHSGTAPSGWKIDGNTLIKLAKGFFFMAY